MGQNTLHQQCVWSKLSTTDYLAWWSMNTDLARHREIVVSFSKCQSHMVPPTFLTLLSTAGLHHNYVNYTEKLFFWAAWLFHKGCYPSLWGLISIKIPAIMFQRHSTNRVIYKHSDLFLIGFMVHCQCHSNYRCIVFHWRIGHLSVFEAPQCETQKSETKGILSSQSMSSNKILLNTITTVKIYKYINSFLTLPQTLLSYMHISKQYDLMLWADVHLS